MEGVGGVRSEGKAAKGNPGTYDSGMACVMVGVCKSDVFKVCKGVRQGCTLSPWLLNVLINKVVWKTKEILKVGEAVHWGAPFCRSHDTAEGLERNLKVMSQVLSR